MFTKKVSGKALLICLTLIVTLLSSICLGAIQWNYLVSTSIGLTKGTTTFGRKAVNCYGTTTVDGINRAGATALLQTIDEYGDWVTVTGWSDYGVGGAIIDEIHAVGNGTYRLQILHTAFDQDDVDYEYPLESFYDYSDIVTYP